MRMRLLTLIGGVFRVAIAALCFASVLSAQDLKGRPQGNEFLKLNGMFEIPAADGIREPPAASMIVADLNGDGINELITGRDGGLSVQMGDINAFAPRTQEAWEAIRDLRFLSPFERDLQIIKLPIWAEFLLAGDFNRDGRMDLIAATRGGNSIFLVEGDGFGGHCEVREIQMSGALTALAVGDANRPDGLPDVVVGVGRDGEYSIAVYHGLGDIFNAEPEDLEVNSRVEQILTGQFDENTFNDVAVSTGGELIIFGGHDADSKRPDAVRLPLSFALRGIATGDFIPDRDFRSEFALLGDDGFIRIFARGDLDTRPVSKSEQLAVQAFGLMKQGIPVPQRVLREIDNKDLREKPESLSTGASGWNEADSFYGTSSDNLAETGPTIMAARLSNRGGDDIIVMDPAERGIKILPLVLTDDGEPGVETSYVGKRGSVKFDLDGAPRAIVAGRFNFDGDMDLMVLEDGKSTPAALLTAPEAAFTVNNAGDQVDANPGNGVCATAGAVCTLRAAIMEANHLAGTDSITINPGINITLSTGSPDNDANGVFNFEGGGDLDITCAVNAGGDTCNAPLATNVNNLTITGAAGGNTIAVGAFTPFAPLTSTTDRVFDIGFDGLFGGGFGAGTGLVVAMSNLTIQSGNVREDFNAGGGGFSNFARGGAIRLDGFGQSGTRGTLTLTSVTINNNQADHNSGGIFNQFANVSISSSTVSNNVGKAGPGGGLQFAASTPATLSVSGSTFSANEARTGNLFGNPQTDVDGGGIYATLDTNTATITSTNFTNNISQDDGGAIYVASGATTVTGGTLSGNTARDDGGAIAGDNDTVSALRFMTLSGATIQSNTANSDNSGGGDGGGVFRDRGTLNVTNCSVGLVGNPNAAVNGGGIAHAFRAAVTPSNQTTINIDNGSITGNNATTGGGGVFINATNQNVGTPSVLNVGSTTSVAVTENNSNVHGGGFAISGNVTANVTRATIHGNDADKDNNATGDGGGIFHNNSGGTLTIPATVTLGTAGQGNTGENGGAIHHSVGTLNLTGTGIASNTTDIHGGGLFVVGGTVNVNGVTFAANTSTSGTEVRLTGGTTNFSNTLTIPGELSIAGGTLSAGSSTVNLGEDFNFTSGTFTAGTSTFNFNGTAAQQIYGGAVPTFNNLTDANTADRLSVNNNANVNGNITVNANAVLNPAAASVIGGTGTLTGNGTVRVTRTAATADFLSQYTIVNKTLTNLLVDLVGAGAQVVSSTTYGGLRINNASSATLGGTATVNGALTLQAVNLTVGTNTLNINGSTTATGGAQILSSATGTVNYGQLSDGQSVLPGNYGNLTFSNFNKTLPNGTVGIAGTFTPGSGVGHTITGNTMTFNGTGVQTIPNFTYNNLSTATSGVKTTGTAVTVNSNATVGSGTTLLVPTGSTLTVTGTLTNNGTIQGLGTIANNFSNSGTLSPGLSPGIMNVTGTFTNAGTLSIEIGGTGGAGVNPNGHDQLLVSGALTMGGNLAVTLTNGFVPAPGNAFVIVDGASATGSFATASMPNISPNVWRLRRNDAAGTYTLDVLPPTAAAASISGRVLSANGAGIRNARVTATDSNGMVIAARTNTFGSYRLDGLLSGETYTIFAEAKSNRFPSRVISLTDSVTDFDFIGQTANR